MRIAERVADGLVPPIVTADLEARVRASTGIAVARAGTTPAHLLRDADLAMYHAKREGRSGFHVFDGSLLVAVDERLALQQALPGAIADGAVHVHYQPIVAVPGGAVMGFEALARWSHDGAPVSPAVFVPLAVDAGLMAELGGGVARAALADLEALRALAPAARLFLNVSARELEHDGYAERLLAALAAAGASPADVVLELTESELAREGVADACHALRDRGFAFAIDDFGAGWSNLGYLRTLPVEVVKVDRGLLGSGDAAADRKLLEGLVALARSLGIAALCEGVETEAQRDRRRRGRLRRRAGLPARPARPARRARRRPRGVARPAGSPLRRARRCATMRGRRTPPEEETTCQPFARGPAPTVATWPARGPSGGPRA